MNTMFETQPKSFTKEAEYISDVKHISYEDFISNSIYLRNRYQQSLIEHFDNLKLLWLEETKMSSNVFITLKHPAHIKIIELGIDVLPMLLHDLRDNKNHWFYTLSIITNHNPIKTKNLGNIDKMIDDWLEWGKSNNFIN